MAVVVGKTARFVEIGNAMDYVYGYCIAQDITAKDWQNNEENSCCYIAKSLDSFCPLGPSITHKSLICDVHDLRMRTSINGEEKQFGNTSQMIFQVDELICRLSQ